MSITRHKRNNNETFELRGVSTCQHERNLIDVSLLILFRCDKQRMLGSFETKDDAVKAIEVLCNKLIQEHHDEELVIKNFDCIHSTRLRRANEPQKNLWLDHEICMLALALCTAPDLWTN